LTEYQYFSTKEIKWQLNILKAARPCAGMAGLVPKFSVTPKAEADSLTL